MEIVFWSSLAFVFYVYAGYPMLLDVWARAAARRSRRPERRSALAGSLPGISIVIAARDEARRLPARIDNLLALDYPDHLLEIIVASDGSTDDVEEALAPYASRITLLMLPAAGKANALNAAVARATHPIVVFADARQRFAPDAVRHLVARFDDATVGAVSGELIIESSSSTIGDGVGAYWRYEKWLRRREAIVGSTLGVTGAIYAMRRWLWQPLPADTILDDVLGPMRAVLRGYRVVFEPCARAFDTAAKDAATERRRKVRTLAGNFQILARELRLLVPFVNPVWLQFVSHKVGRLFVPYALVALLVASAVLGVGRWALGVERRLFYALAFLAQAAFYALAAYGALLERRDREVPASAHEVIGDTA